MTETKSEAGSIKPKIELGVNYWKLWTSSVISNLGDGVTAIALPWLASAATRNPILIALVAVASRIPWLVFTLPAGVITDRVDRRKLMWWSQTFRSALMFGAAGMVLSIRAHIQSPARSRTAWYLRT